MAGAPGGLTASIRRKLREGRSPDDIVQELVAGGLGQVSAQRFVDRALAEDASGAALPPPPAPPVHAPAHSAEHGDALDQFIQEKSAQTKAAEEKSGSKSLWVGSMLMCGGIVITAGSYVMADVGERYTLMWGPVVFGFFLWAKAVVSGFSHARSFAWFSAGVSIALPIVLAMLSLGVVAATESTEQQAFEAELAAVLEKKNMTPEEHAAIEKVMDDEVEAQRLALDPDELLAAFDEAEPGNGQCAVTHQMSRYTGEAQAYLASELNRRIATETPRVKVCGARAIMQLDPEAGAALYREWYNGSDPQLKAAATVAMRSR